MVEIFEKIKNNTALTYSDCLKMLSVEIGSADYMGLLASANRYARTTFKNKATIFAQIGLDARPCSANCKFCTFAVDNFNEINASVMTEEAVLANVEKLILAGADEIFLMTTADYDKEQFLHIASEVRKIMHPNMKLVANTSDFDLDYALKLKEAGFTGVYHICRLNEGIDTDLNVDDRIKTLDALTEAGLELYYCVEPIGPEHTNEQIADEIFRAIDYDIQVMAVMRRISFCGGPLEPKGEITAQKLALICAVTTLCVKPKRAMGVHEPESLSLLAGANQLYAENGSNPRDVILQTEKNRGFSVYDAQKMLTETGWVI